MVLFVNTKDFSFLEGTSFSFTNGIYVRDSDVVGYHNFSGKTMFETRMAGLETQNYLAHAVINTCYMRIRDLLRNQ